MSYNAAVLDRIDKNGDGTGTIVLRYTGNAGEEIRFSFHPINAIVMPSADYVRGLAMERMNFLNTNRSFLIGSDPFVGTTLDTTTPLPPIVPPTFGLYGAATASFTPGATPQDVFTITGSATKTVRVMSIGLSSVQTTAGMNAWQLLKRSAANSGGTSALVTGVPMDDSYPAATATVRQYTANPTPGASIGPLWSGRIVSPAPASATLDQVEKIIGDLRSAMVLLSGITDVLAWNFNGAALPTGLSVQAWVWWTETTPGS